MIDEINSIFIVPNRPSTLFVSVMRNQLKKVKSVHEKIVAVCFSGTPKMSFNTVVYMPDCVPDSTSLAEIEQMLGSIFQSRFKAIGFVPARFNNEIRWDLFLYVHDDDIPKFSLLRIALHHPQCQLKWWQDVYFNNIEKAYPQEFCDSFPNEHWS
jgi:hypothetical protein